MTVPKPPTPPEPEYQPDFVERHLGNFIVLGIIVFLGYTACSKLGELTRGSDDKAVVGNLGALRSALSIYYGDMEGVYPQELGSLTVNGKYISTILKLKIKNHPKTRGVTYFSEVSEIDSGTWGYVNNPYDSNLGTMFIDCTHTDYRGTVWTTY